MIKKLSIFASLVFAVATPAAASSFDDTDVKVCRMFGLTAKAVMTGRQYGETPTSIRQELQKIATETKMPSMLQAADIYIVEAHEIERHKAESLRKWEIGEFQSKKEMDCLNYFANKKSGKAAR